MKLPDVFRMQADACAHLGSPMYAELLSRAAEDIAAGGVTAQVLVGREHDPGPSAVALRLLGSVHRLVLQGRADELAAYYPSAGGTWELGGGWPAFERLLSEQAAAVREWLDRPPQTNEVGRAGALMGGLLHLPREHPVRLFELGSSGGLNLLVDRFGYGDDFGAVHGDPASPVRLDDAWRGRRLVPWPELEIVERLGCDVLPLDPTTAEGRLALTAYVWPDQATRLERLRGALELARQHPPPVRRTAAAELVSSIALRPGTTTVLWHSVVWQYLGAEEQAEITARIEQLGAGASPERPFAHLFLEPTRRQPGSDHEFLVVLTVWPGDERKVLGSSRGHGIPTTWE